MYVYAGQFNVVQADQFNSDQFNFAVTMLYVFTRVVQRLISDLKFLFMCTFYKQRLAYMFFHVVIFR